MTCPNQACEGQLRKVSMPAAAEIMAEDLLRLIVSCEECGDVFVVTSEVQEIETVGTVYNVSNATGDTEADQREEQHEPEQ